MKSARRRCDRSPTRKRKSGAQSPVRKIDEAGELTCHAGSRREVKGNAARVEGRPRKINKMKCFAAKEKWINCSRQIITVFDGKESSTVSLLTWPAGGRSQDASNGSRVKGSLAIMKNVIIFYVEMLLF